VEVVKYIKVITTNARQRKAAASKDGLIE